MDAVDKQIAAGVGVEMMERQEDPPSLVQETQIVAPIQVTDQTEGLLMGAFLHNLINF